MSTEGSSTLFQRCPRTLDRKRVRAFQRTLVEQVTGGRHFTCLLTRDGELQRMNRQFLGHDYPTDVLSFPALDSLSGLGEIAISVDRAAEQAAGFGHDVETEIAILMLHGVLHLMGMDHEGDRGRMARAEKNWRAKLGLPAGLIERAKGRR